MGKEGRTLCAGLIAASFPAVPEGWVNVFDAQAEAERKLEPGPRGVASPAELGREHVRSAPPTCVYSG